MGLFAVPLRLVFCVGFDDGAGLKLLTVILFSRHLSQKTTEESTK